MIRFPLFRRRYMTFRVGQLNKIRPLSELQELPVGAVLHILDNFAMVGEKMKYHPHLDNPFINMNQFKLYVYNMTGPGKEPLSTDVVPYTLAKMILTNSGIMGQLQEFKRSLSPRVMWSDDITSLPNRPIAQAIVNYNAIFRARVMGVRRKVRFMNFLWAQIINTIVRAPDRTHFIHIPLETLQFEKKDFVRVFKKYDRIATKYPEISSYLFLAHFYSILNKRMVLPKRGMEFEDAEDAVESMQPDVETYDPESNSKEWFTALKDYMLKPEYLDASMEAIKGDENPYNLSIFEFLPPRMFENINFIFTCGPNYICYNLRDLKELNASGAALMRIIKQVNMLTSSAGTTSSVDEVAAVEEPPMVAEEVTDVDESGETPNQPTFAIPMSKEETEAAYDMDLKELDDIDRILDHTINEVKTGSSQPKKPLTPAQKEHIKVIGKQYKKLTMNGKTFEQLMTEVPTFDEKPPELENIEAVKDGSIPKEATQSTTVDLDRNYLKQMFDRDLANILTSFNKQGMFLVGFQEEVQTDELNDKKTFVAAYEDINHKQHKLRFSIPNLDENGRFKSNGTTKSMVKQRVSNPICKVSPTRVTLNSNYNKLLVERNEAVAHSFKDWFASVMSKCSTGGFRMQAKHAAYAFPNKPFPFELTEIGSKFESISFDGGSMFVHVPDRGNYVPEKLREKVKESEKDFGYWFGYKGDDNFFMTVKGAVTVRNLKTGEETLYGAFEDFVEWLAGMEFKKVTEYIDLTVLSKRVPIILPLGFRYGLTEMLKYTGADYETFDAGTRYEKRNSDIIVKFKDKHLVVRRTPRMCALLFGGLTIYDFSDVTLEEMDEKDVYYDMLQQKKLSINTLKGIDAMFDLFIDPITRDVLRELRQPTDLRDLMLRAITMLTTSEHLPAASAVNFRFRGAEQVTGIVYNELAKTFANFRNRAVGAGNKFSIKEFQIKQRIEQDQLSENVSIINPLDDIKQFSKFSNAGSGGRSNETFRVPDRQFTEDSVGVVSEATVDNGKVGLNATLPANPVFANGRGMVSEFDRTQLRPENMLSMTALVMAGATNDDSKRANFANIQASHVVPIKESEVSRVRTGYEEIVAQRTKPPFAYSAREDGTITNIDPKNGVLTIHYKNGERVCLNFGTEFTNNSANGFYVDQEVSINGFKVGDKFKRGDILTYNNQFFQSDPYSKQVRWKIGILAKVALMDNGGTIEDASILTQPFCDRMEFNPTHVREVVLTTKTNIHKCVGVGDEVISTEPLIVWDQSEVNWGEGGDSELANLLSDINRNSAKAEYTGVIAQVDALYKSPISAMSPSMQKIVRKAIERKNARAAIASTCSNSRDFQKSQPLTATDKVGIVDLDQDTVILRFYIKQKKGMQPGDKLFFDNCLKSVCSTVYPESIMTEDGQKVDCATSARGVLARIIVSPFITGLGNSVLEKLEQNVIDVFDGRPIVDQNAK